MSGVWLDGQVIALVGSLVLGAVAAVLLVHTSRLSRKSAAAMREAAQQPDDLAGLSVSQESEGRVEQAAQLLTALLARDYPVTSDHIRRRLLLAGQSSFQGGHLDLPGEVADGVVMISRVVPEIALHDNNVELITKLRGLVGSRDFLFVCGQMTAGLTTHPQHELAEGLRRGDLTWIEFLSMLRILLPVDTLHPNQGALPLKDLTGLFNAVDRAATLRML